MSALGQKQTYAVQNPMSALPPIATAKADSRKRSCRLCPRKRTCAVHQLMSALGQKRTCIALFDHLVGACKHRRRHGEVERLGSLEVDNQLVLGTDIPRIDSTSRSHVARTWWRHAYAVHRAIPQLLAPKPALLGALPLQ